MITNVSLSSLSVIGPQQSGGGAELVALLKDREGNSATLCAQVTKLTAALQEYQDMVQVRSDHQDFKDTLKKQTLRFNVWFLRLSRKVTAGRSPL